MNEERELGFEMREEREKDWVSAIGISTKREREKERERERAFGSSSLSSVFVFGFSKSFWLIEEKFSFLHKYNEKKLLGLCYCLR